MKTYEILVNKISVSDYAMGQINGIIHAITGMTKREYPWIVSECGMYWELEYRATEEQHKMIVEFLDKFYSRDYNGAKRVEYGDREVS